MLAGTLLSARSVSLTVTVKLWLTGLLLSSLSLTVQVTVVVPMGKVPPESGCNSRSEVGCPHLPPLAAYR